MTVDQSGLAEGLLNMMFPDGISPDHYNDLLVLMINIRDLEDLADQINRHENKNIAVSDHIVEANEMIQPAAINPTIDDSLRQRVFELRDSGKNVKEIGKELDLDWKKVRGMLAGRAGNDARKSHRVIDPLLQELSKPEFEQCLADLDAKAEKQFSEGKGIDKIIADAQADHPNFRPSSIKERIIKIFRDRNQKPSLESEITKLHDIGCSNREIKERLGMQNAKLIRQVVKDEVKAEVAEEQKHETNITLPIATVRRILTLDEEKMTPATISDCLEEDFGLVVSEGEIMDVIVKHAKGMA